MKSDSAEEKTSRGQDGGMRRRESDCLPCQTLIPAPLEEDKVVITKARRHIPLHGTGGGGLCDGIASVLHLPS